jgi:putative Mn2+ efflux pump MntP
MKRKRGQRFSIHVDNEVREVFLGHHTLFSVISFTVGGILIGETIKEYLYDLIGFHWTLAVGLILVVFSGTILHKFSDKPVSQGSQNKTD